MVHVTDALTFDVDSSDGFVVAHVSDLHLDHGQFSRIDPDSGVQSAWESADRCWQHSCDWAVENRPSVFLFTGDAFGNGRPTPEAQERFAIGLRKVARAGVPVVVVRGNHELIGVAPRHRDVLTRYQDIPGVHIVNGSPELVTLDSGLQIACVPWPRRHEILAGANLDGLDPGKVDGLISNALVDVIDGFADDVDLSRGPAVLAGHFTVSTAKLGSDKRGSEVQLAALFDEPVVPVDLLSEDPWSYVALGHIHKQQKVSDRGWYAGSPDRIDFSEENDPKGFLTATISNTEPGGQVPIADVAVVENPARRMLTLRLDGTPRLDALDRGTLVKVFLPDGERVVPAEIQAAVKDAGAVIVKVDRRPARPQRNATTSQVDVDTPVLDAFGLWLDRSDVSPEERPALIDGAKELLDQGPVQ